MGLDDSFDVIRHLGFYLLINLLLVRLSVVNHSACYQIVIFFSSFTSTRYTELSFSLLHSNERKEKKRKKCPNNYRPQSIYGSGIQRSHKEKAFQNPL